MLNEPRNKEELMYLVESIIDKCSLIIGLLMLEIGVYPIGKSDKQIKLEWDRMVLFVDIISDYINIAKELVMIADRLDAIGKGDVSHA